MMAFVDEQEKSKFQKKTALANMRLQDMNGPKGQ